MIIDLNAGENVKTILYPDNQPHVAITGDFQAEVATVYVSLIDSIKVLELLELSEALDHYGIRKLSLNIPYLMAARFDRRMQYGDSFDLRVIAKLINSCGFANVRLLDVHSDVATTLIERSVNLSNSALLAAFMETSFNDKPLIICPDAGAAKRTAEAASRLGVTDIVYCSKTRDLSNGNLTLTVNDPGRCAGRNCVIIDDLCDGGGTFNAIASQIPTAKSKTLIVTHGIFSKGLSELDKNFDLIITTDSYRIENHKKVRQLNVRLMM